ncbi:peptide deformylase [Paracoccus sp. Z118]|uniref:peptide deformylase n=1 Tax=Paracoccus sp. Z118 TaxID=2851017 RepID=UPI001C2B7F89|nr:peptide deformylase [Paracoccus sp. Z118]
MTAPDRDAATGPQGRVLPVLRHPDARLRERCAPAAAMPWPEAPQLAADLLATMYAAEGRGLAAPQVGIAARMFVMDAAWKADAPEPRVLLDPAILWRSPEFTTADEQCLSIPGPPVPVARPAAIRLRWFDLDGGAHEAGLSGIEARIAQHEIDHLDGILILDHGGGADA